MSEVKKWVSVKRSAKGNAVVTTSLVNTDARLSASWSVAATSATIADGVRDSDAGAQCALRALERTVRSE